ncbi:MAG: aspartyl-tRNA(Asn)/glutamyl-tRNA(Gln) amidotransferase subunit C [Sphingobacteriales bacterium]|jgi:aspartyl-tRNA(Asn)/glutamyl-tRNA(Gln) amidotransferase subunit C
MKVDSTLVQKLATLSRLEFSEEQEAKMIQDMNRMLDFVEKLNELDTENVEPLIYMSDEVNVLRKDIAEQKISHKDALKNAPKKDSDYFRVPKVISQ